MANKAAPELQALLSTKEAAKPLGATTVNSAAWRSARIGLCRPSAPHQDPERENWEAEDVAVYWNVHPDTVRAQPAAMSSRFGIPNVS